MSEDQDRVNRDPECLFCRICAGEVPSTTLHADADVVAFADINPVAPTHVVIVPSAHYATAAELAEHQPTVLARLVGVAHQVAEQANLTGYRLVFNTGADAGQTVFHTHLHLIGGRQLTWPPG